MIFKHLFRSKYQNPDPQVRIQAIQNLDKQDPEQKSVLHELAFNDSDVGVSLAALQKLDSFVLWYKMSEIAKNERVQKKSQQFVENTLLDGTNQDLSEREKREFMLQTGDIRLIEKLLAQPWVQKDSELAMQLLQKVDKPQLKEKLLLESQNECLQTAILGTLTDGPGSRKLLTKIHKKSASTSLQEMANQMLQDWLAAAQAPIEVEQQVTMILSRMLALKDHHDLLHIQHQHAQLTEQYNQIALRFACLSHVKRVEIEQKYADICSRIERVITLLTPQWQAQQAAQALSQSLQRLQDEVEQNLATLSAQLSSRIGDIQSTEVDTFVASINQQTEELHSLTKQLPASNQTAHRSLEQLNNQLTSHLNTLKNLPKLQQAIALCQGLLAKFESLALPDDASQIEAAQEYLNEQKQLWRTAVGDYQGHIPADLAKQWQQCLKSWQQSIKVLRNQLDGELSRCRNKLKAVESLINQGKFKAAMMLYQKVQKWFEVLPEKQQAQLERSYLGVKQQIENLKDWQDYIAAPRKPALLDEVEALIAQPLEIEAQAKAIKSLRYQWNSLGKIDSESDQALNQAFEIAIEKAFTPCREHYDKQQQEREHNMLAKQQILAELKALSDDNGSTAELAKSLRSLQQKWKKIGEVDFKQRNALFDSYQQLLSPLRAKVAAFYQDNAEQKQVLLTKAEKLLELESVEEAIEQAKKLQQTWKTIEHAGSKAESKLWPAFRKANDTLFAKKAQANKDLQAEIKQQVSLVKDKVTQLETLLNSADDKASVQNALQDKAEVTEALDSLPAQERRSLEQRLLKLESLQRSKLTELVKSAKGQAYQDLFTALKEWQTAAQIPDSVANLSKQWQQCFTEQSADNNRHELTIKMEIVAQQDSPAADAHRRQSIQMQLMAQKLQTGESLDLHSLLKDWIKAGCLSKSDLTLLKRVEPLFVS